MTISLGSPGLKISFDHHQTEPSMLKLIQVVILDSKTLLKTLTRFDRNFFKKNGLDLIKIFAQKF